jgi:hypothetical protein
MEIGKLIPSNGQSNDVIWSSQMPGLASGRNHWENGSTTDGEGRGRLAEGKPHRAGEQPFHHVYHIYACCGGKSKGTEISSILSTAIFLV